MDASFDKIISCGQRQPETQSVQRASSLPEPVTMLTTSASPSPQLARRIPVRGARWPAVCAIRRHRYLRTPEVGRPIDTVSGAEDTNGLSHPPHDWTHPRLT